jgi:hypothetical protein
VSLTWETRHQNYSLVSICNVNAAACKDSLVMTELNGWMELDQNPVKIHSSVRLEKVRLG